MTPSERLDRFTHLDLASSAATFASEETAVDRLRDGLNEVRVRTQSHRRVLELLKVIESLEFSARLNAASGTAMFVRAASQETAVTKLRYDLNEVGVDTQLLTRVLELSRMATDMRYRHKWDTALAVYVWLLNAIDPAGTGVAAVAAEVVSQTPQCWWAWQLASPILLRQQNQTLTRDQGSDVPIRGSLSSSAAQPKATHETLVQGGFVRERSRFAKLNLVTFSPASTEAKAA